MVICSYLRRELIDYFNLVFGWLGAITILYSFALVLFELNFFYWEMV